ncbi:helix-turn-helix transcriptional regulator [Psychroserpens sp. AS72]|uniref:helix-turn-helix domain-containing protein n=1 Tax=Psychroserpens sp. AS72 TaxID=3135775 RepID=UPI00316E09F2
MQLSKQKELKLIKEIGVRIRELRQERQLSQFQLNIDANLSKNQIGRIERAEHIPNIITLYKIAESLDVSISEIVDLKKNII